MTQTTTSKLKTGGYHGIRAKVIKTLNNAHTTKLERPISGAALDALNWTQKTRWRLNRSVLAVALEMKDAGYGCEGLPADGEFPLPVHTAEEQFAALSKEEQRRHMADIATIRTRNARSAGQRAAVYRRLQLAKELASFPALWFPHFLDFRGRLYPLPQDLHTQGDTLTKGLLEFAEPVALGPRGKWWLYVVTANAFGHDKLPLNDRAAWTEANLDAIIAAALDPLARLDFWADDGAADSPWEALALCFEVLALSRWEAAGNGPETFESYAPVRLDATCSGIQHLSAMMRDTLSATAVNVQPTGKREDIYGGVRATVQERCALDAANGNALAIKWLGKIERKTVKRAVMTTPYGVTERGIVDQLVADGFCDFEKDGKERYKLAEYLKDLIVGALDANIGQPRAAMQYFQAVARHLAEKDVPLQWTTPAGFTVRQAYYQLGRVRLYTLIGEVDLMPEEVSAGLIVKKQTASAAPNVVHSFDAAHLCLTAVAMKRDGIRDLAFVHDSFGSHAGHADTLARNIREEFVAMYAGPVLEQWRQSVIDHTGVEDIPPIPELGSLDVSNVLASEFFFS